MNNKNDLKEKLKTKLKELFQFDYEDLDFGIYRIMNYKREEIEKFIEEDLIEGIKKELELTTEDERKEIEERVIELSSKNGVKKYLEAVQKGDEERIKIYREDFPEKISEYESYKRQLDEIKISEELEKEIYNHIVNFFTRYYDNGDFISKRRYGKNEKYVIPYNGEEVKLYWANYDQYYIKTTEYFRKYSFKTIKGGVKVNFRVVEAEEESGNAKAQEKKYFTLNEKIFDFDDKTKELNIYFEYRAITKEEAKERDWGNKDGNGIKQDKINEVIIEILENEIPQNSAARLIFEKENDKTLIEKHLYKYTKRNTTDYFIHKDLKGFLERELDFYIKNEFLKLDDLQILEESGYFDKLRLYLIGVRAFRKIAFRIIEFLAQIENFQKKLWEKRKFVIDTQYVITLDKIKEFAGEEFLENILDEVLKNTAQLNEWKELFGIEVKNRNDLIEKETLEGVEWKKLPVDTKYFDEEFKWKLLETLTENNNLDNILNGVLIKSENFQALNLLLKKYYEKIQTIYIDPPFNKENEADYLYKVGYKDATWITMLENRLKLGKDALNDKGSIFIRCDYNGNMYVRMLLDKLFGREHFNNEITVGKTPGKKKTGLSLSYTKDYLLFYGKTLNNLINILSKKTDKYSFYEEIINILTKLNTSNVSEINNYLKENFFWVDLDHRPGERKENKRRILFNIEFAPPKGRHWIKSQAKLDDLYKLGKARIKCKNCGKIFNSQEELYECCENKNWVIQIFLDEDLIADDWSDISGYSQTHKFQTENSEILLKRVIETTSDNNDLVLDFFLGSGTTTAVAQKLGRKWLGVEMGEHFWTVVLPRMKKTLYYDKSGISKEKDVKVKYNAKNAGGFFKYHTLEQYEDALENIEFENLNETQQKLLNELSDYFVKYMLEWETKKSKTFLNAAKLKDPFNYKLKIIEDYKPVAVNADIVETFNYLLGINVNKYKILNKNGRKYVYIFGEKEGKKATIVWRNLKELDLEKDKEEIEKTIKDFNPDEIYVNGDAIIEGFRPIEPLFNSLMFEKA